MRIFLFLAVLAAALTSTPAHAKERGSTVDDRVAACLWIVEERAYGECLNVIEDACGTIRSVSKRRTCEAVVQTARAEFELAKVRGDLAVARRATTGSGRSDAVGIPAVFSVELPAIRPAGLVLTVQNPLGSAWESCGTCERFYGLQNHGPNRAWVFYVDGTLAPVVYGNRTRPVVIDLDGNGQLDAAELSGIPAASGADTTQAYLVSPPGRKVEVRAVEYILDPTLGGGVYAPTGWTKLELKDTRYSRSSPTECVVAH